jgi:hypothetical protein
LFKTIKFKWEEIEYIREVKWIWRGTIFKVKPIGKRPFYTCSDSASKIIPVNPFEDHWNAEKKFQTKMSDFVFNRHFKSD